MKTWIKYGLIAVGIYTIVNIIFFSYAKICTGMFCGVIPFLIASFPAFMIFSFLNDIGSEMGIFLIFFYYIFNAAFYFLFGAIIGLRAEKVRKK